MPFKKHGAIVRGRSNRLTTTTIYGNAYKGIALDGMATTGSNMSYKQQHLDTDRHEIGEDWHYHMIQDNNNQPLWHGQYDLYPLWSHFGIPDDLKDKTVLDIGTAGQL